MPRLLVQVAPKKPADAGFFVPISMHNRTLFFAQAFVLLAVGIVHVSALQWYLYWYYPWLDLLTHFLGGLWVAFAAAWLLNFLGKEINFWLILGAVMIVGIGWEVFEVLIGITVMESNYILDTSLDILMDFCGGLFGFLGASHIIGRAIIGTQ